MENKYLDLMPTAVRVYFGGFFPNGVREVLCDAKYSDGEILRRLPWNDTYFDEYTIIHDERAMNRFE